MKIFYSWQTDTPDSIGTSYIRLALNEAVSEIIESIELNEAERPTIDQDTQGVMGSPAIAETIFEKIRNSEVVVVDVTLVGETTLGKQLINSNVAYELGFAHGHHGDQVLLPVMNTHYGSPEKLPFDLKHRRWPVRFELSPDAKKAQRKSVRKALTKELSVILKLYLENCPPGKKYEPIPSKKNSAMYWQDDELLVQRPAKYDDESDVELGYISSEPLSYLRLWPDKPLGELSGKQLNDYNLSEIQPFLEQSGYSSCRNKYGTITYSGENAGELFCTTQVFKNREIWGVEAFLLRAREDFDFTILPTGAFEEGLTRSLKKYLKTAFEKFEYTDVVHVEAGLVNVVGARLAMPNDYSSRFWGPIFEDICIKTTVQRDDPETINKALLKIFEAVFDAAGTERPKNLYGFPGAS